MAGVARAIVSPLSIIDKGLGKAVLQVVAVVAPFIPGGAPIAAIAALALATLYKPKTPKPEQTERAIKVAVPPRVSAYGRVKLFGAYCLFQTSTKGVAVDVWAFHDGRIDGIERYYLSDKQVTINASGFVIEGADGAYGDGDTIQIGTRLGLDSETAFSEVIAAVPEVWTTDHRGDGIVTGCMVSKPVKAKNYNKVYPQGGPDATPLGLVVRAQCVFDWRDTSQSVDDPLTWRWSENNALHVVHYYLIRAGKDWQTHFLPTLSYWTAFADDCDVAMPLKNGGTEARYRSCVSHKHTDTHKAVIGNLLACCDGFVAPRSDGALMAFSGRYVPPTVSVGPDIIVDYSWDEGVVDEDAINEVAITYLSDQHDYTAVDATAWQDVEAIDAAGEIKSTSLDNQVPSHAQARRLAKRLLSKTMALHRGSVTTSRRGRIVRGQRFINLHIEEAGAVFYSGPAEITRLTRNLSTGGVTFTWIAADPNIDEWNPATEEGNPAPVGDVVATEPLSTPTIISATAQYSAVGQTPEGDEPVDPSPGQTATGARILIAASGPDRADVTWFARWRVGTSGSWNEREYADADPGPGVSFLTEFVPLATNINVQVSYSVGDGRLSAWSASKVVNTTNA
jgi:hypothetical protein